MIFILFIQSAGVLPILRRTQENKFGSGTIFVGVAHGTSKHDPFCFAEYEQNLPKCKPLLSKKRGTWACPHGPDCGPLRVHGSSGTSATHMWHLDRMLRLMLESRGLVKLEKPIEVTATSGYIPPVATATVSFLFCSHRGDLSCRLTSQLVNPTIDSSILLVFVSDFIDRF